LRLRQVESREALAHSRRAVAIRVQLEVQLVLGARAVAAAERLAHLADQLLGFLRSRVRRQVEDPVEQGDGAVVVLSREIFSGLRQHGQRVGPMRLPPAALAGATGTGACALAAAARWLRLSAALADLTHG
jgi:hypothetical protein